MSANDKVSLADQLLKEDKPAAAAVLLMHGDMMEFDKNIAALLSVSDAERAAAEAFLGSLGVFQPVTLVLRLALVISSPTSSADLRSKSADMLLGLVASGATSCPQFSAPVVNVLKSLLLKGLSSHPAKDTLGKIRDVVFHLSQAHEWPELLSRVIWFASPVNPTDVQASAFILLASLPRSEPLIARARELHSLVYLAQSSSSFEVRVAALGAGGNICHDMGDRNLMNDLFPLARSLVLELKASGFLSCARHVRSLESAMSTMAIMEDATNRNYALAIINDYIGALRSNKLVCSLPTEYADDGVDKADKVLLRELKSFSSMSISPINAFSAFGIAVANYEKAHTSDYHRTILLYFALLFLSFSLLGFGVINAVQVMKKPKSWMVTCCVWIVFVKVLYVKIYASLLGLYIGKAIVWCVVPMVLAFAAASLSLMVLTSGRPRWIHKRLMKKSKFHKQ